MSFINTILFDFDGVVTPKTPQMFVSLTHKVINKHTYIAEETILRYFQSIISFSPWDSIQLFFNELGIKHLITDLQKEYLHAITDNPEFSGMIDEEFFFLTKLLDLNKIQWKIVSLGATGHLTKTWGIKLENIYELKNESKANPETYSKLIKFLGVEPKQCLLVDDGILSIRAAKLNEIRTVFMQNNFYGIEQDYQLYKEFVDHRAFNLKELSQYISELL